ncbi:MAG: prolipoprotein diacylglyceryl transferase [Deferribacterales bacterium]
MFPVLFKIGFFELRVYSLMYILALVIGMYMVKRKAALLNLSKEAMENAGIICFLAGILGARIYYVIFRWDYYQGNFFEMLAVWHGGLAIHGGIIGALAGLYIFSRVKRSSLLGMADAMIPWLLLGQAIGRIGNLANGEAHGVPTLTPPSIIFRMKNEFGEFWHQALSQAGLENASESISKLAQKVPFDVDFNGKVYTLKEYFPWGISFGKYKSTPAYFDFGALPVHPTFIYEMILNFACFVPLYIMWKNDKNIGRGVIVGWYLIFYGFIRAFVTFFRADDLMIGYLRAPHMVSIFMVAVGFLLVTGRLVRNSRPAI